MDLHDGSAQPASDQSRRASDPTRLLPWLRDKNKRFKALTDAECDAIFRFATLHRVQANTVLQAFDMPPSGCFVLISGAAVIRVRRANGSLRELDRYGPGDIVGVLALVDDQPSPYEIVAASAVEVIAFEVDQMAQFAAAFHPDALLAIRAWTPIVIESLRGLQLRVSRLAMARRDRVKSANDDAWKGGA